MELEKSIKKESIISREISKALDIFFVPTSFIRDQIKSKVPLKNEIGNIPAYMAIGIAELGRLYAYGEVINTIANYFINQ